MLERYIRQMAFAGIGAEGQKKLSESYVVIVGCGALGTVIANNLARAGVGKIKIVDRDFVEKTNLQRQTLFTEEDVINQTPKAIAATQYLRLVNSEIEIIAEILDVNPSNIERVIAGADIVLDGTDNFETRFLLNDACVKYGIPWVYGGAVGSFGMTMNIIPGQTPCFQCLVPVLPAPGSQPTCETAGILGMTTAVIGSLQSAEAIKILIGSPQIRKEVLMIDVWQNHVNIVPIEKNQNCHCCGKRNFTYLQAGAGTFVTSLCGRNSMQVIPAKPTTINFAEISHKLSAVGSVSYNQHLLRFIVPPYEIVLFSDGRAIIKNVNDAMVAKTLYTKYIGL